MPKFFSGRSIYASGSGAVAELDETESFSRGYLLGVDGGGTKTHAVITDAESCVVGEGVSGASNPIRVSLDVAISHIESAIRDACAQAGIKPGEISSACIALAGINHPTHYHAMDEALRRALDTARLYLVADAHAALAGALDGRPGIIVIAGTGSIAMGMNPAGVIERSGGWGPTLGDEGSGYDIARRALRAVAASFDGRERQTVLTQRICDRLGIASAADLPGVIYRSDRESVEIAGLARLVTEAADEGDRVARDILAEAGCELAELAVSVIEKLELQSEPFRVACVGSVFNSGEHILKPLRESVSRIAPGAEIGSPIHPPAIGAVKLAIQFGQESSG
ncbi:MAG: ATPase [Blastocatellia bacterium]|nr:ATPase [Blastocatellia bacterium]